MPRPIELGIPARYKYQRVRYSHFDVGPGASLVLTADPWSYLVAWLSQRIASSKGRNRHCLERAMYYAQLAEGFFDASDATQLPTKGTLGYYGMLNLVKCFISARGIELEKTPEHHGLMLRQGSRFEVEVLGRPPSMVSVFYEFARILRTSPTGGMITNFKEVCSHIPEIHEIAHSLGHLPGKRRKFLPVEIDFLVNETKEWLFTEARYEKQEEAHLQTSRFLRNSRARYFKPVSDRNGWVVFRSKRRKRVTKENWERIYANVRNEYSTFNVASLLTRQGYRYYCDLNPGAFHHLCYPFIAMFYIGTVARYRPGEARVLMQGDLKPLVAELVANCPRQFLYQLVSLTTNSICVVPYALLT